VVKAFAYLRVSGRSQVDGDGFERQATAICRHANGNGIEIVQVFEEKAVSGATEWDNRPAWVEMISALNGVRTIVIERLDRLARDLMVQEHIIADLKQRGIELISTAEPDLGSEEPTRILMRQIMGAVAQYDKAMIVLKLRGARQRKKAATGRCEGAKPFGLAPDEQHVLQVITGLRDKGMSTPDIAACLNRGKYATKSQRGQWFASTVARILRRVNACRE
jgi:DNA invertase Pin-like site-specific DNA recombinase